MIKIIVDLIFEFIEIIFKLIKCAVKGFYYCTIRNPTKLKTVGLLLVLIIGAAVTIKTSTKWGILSLCFGGSIPLVYLAFFNFALEDYEESEKIKERFNGMLSDGIKQFCSEELEQQMFEIESRKDLIYLYKLEMKEKDSIVEKICIQDDIKDLEKEIKEISSKNGVNTINYNEENKRIYINFKNTRSKERKSFKLEDFKKDTSNDSIDFIFKNQKINFMGDDKND